MGASGPTLKPNVLVTNDSSNSGKRQARLEGNDFGPEDEKIETKSATVKVEELKADDRIPINRPPNVQSPVMMYAGLRFLPCSIPGMVCQTVLTQSESTFPYKYPIAAVMTPTATDAFMIPLVGFESTAVAPPGDTFNAVLFFVISFEES
mmetsp:Transcript_1298/g.3304  ORF Transcript_1298/g.3304 Transcript_1298/m.3304 type:complete len:150 (+) Transcript_1298:6215-6664(+)